MTQHDYKKNLKQGDKAVRRIFAELAKGNANSLHYAVSGKARDYVLTEFARFRDVNMKNVKFKRTYERNLGREQVFQAYVETEDKVYLVQMSIMQVLENLNWTWKAKRPIVQVFKDKKNLETKKADEPVEIDMTEIDEAIEKEEKSDKKIANAKSDKTKSNRASSKRGTGKAKK